MARKKSLKQQSLELDLLTPRERGVLTLMREGLNDEQIAERLDIDVATTQYDVWGVLSKLGLESRAQIAVSRPPQTAPAPELEPPEPGPDGPAASAPGAPRRMGLRLAAQIFGTGLALIGIGLVAWGLMRMAGDDDGQSAAAVRTPSPASAGATNPPPTANPSPTITPFPAVIPEEPDAFGPFAYRRSLYSIRPDGSELDTVLPAPPRAYAWSPDGTQLAYVQSYGDIDLKFISSAGDALRSMRLEGVFSVDGIGWTPDGSRIVLSVQIAAPPDNTTLMNTIALLDPEAAVLTVLESAPLLPNGLITLPGNPPSVVPHPNTGAALSPDGASVAWPSGEGQLSIGPVDGASPPVVLAGRYPAWSPDGSRLAFQARDEIHVVDRDGSGKERLTPGGQPAWAPADRIAFVRGGDLFVIDPDTAEETQLTSIPLPFAAEPRWSPDGERILFAYAADESEVFTVTSSGEQRTLLVPGSYPQWSPDGASIAFAAGRGKGSVFVMTPDGANLKALPARIFLSDTAPLDAGCHARPFQWSPLGGRLAVCNSQSGNIDVVGVNGESPILAGAGGSSFSWAPDGARIAFTGSEREGALTRPVIYIADVAKPNAPPQRLAEGTTPDWSPDGAKIAYVADDGLHVANLATGKNTLVARGEIARSHVAWAPDSSKLAYVGAGHILVTDLASPDPLAALGEGLGPQWSPDGAQIAYYTSVPNGHEDLWAVHADASPPPRHLGKGRSPAWSPDSARIAYHRFIP